MSLIRGALGLFPCPICLVPKECLMKIWEMYEQRTGKKAKELVEDANAQRRLKDAEKILKSWSLRPIKVC